MNCDSKQIKQQISWVFFIFFFLSNNLIGHGKIQSSRKHNPRQIQVILTNKPSNDDEEYKWLKENGAVRNNLPEYVNFIHDGNVVWQAVKGSLRHVGVMDEKTKNEIFHLKRSLGHDGGYYSFHTPNKFNSNAVKVTIQSWMSDNKIKGEVSHVAGVHCHKKKTPNRNIVGLEGEHISLEELEGLKNKTLISQKKYSLSKLKKQIPTLKEKKEIQAVKAQILSLTKRIAELQKMESSLFWHQEIPTTGIRHSQKFPLIYPFLPHMFLLYDLAPKKGRGITIAVIDTGIAAFFIYGNKLFAKNQDLEISSKINFEYDNCNLVSEDGEDALEQFIYFIEQYIDKNKFHFGSLERLVPAWIKDFLLNERTTSIEKYLVEKGKKEITSGSELNDVGKAALEDITTGPKGIKPKDKSSRFDIVTFKGSATSDKALFQMLPTAQIFTTHESYLSGHGSHTSGIIGGKLQASTPATDTGICGIAPNAELIMIKAFQSDGNSDTATLTAAVKKAILYEADILNLSLKIADKVDLSKESTKLLKALLGLVPYTVVASGNDGSPEYSSDYPGKVESYPGKFENIIFDVGAFSNEDEKFPISVFSQYEPNVGPKFVAPGFNILSSALIPNQHDPSTYVFMDGTSMAAPVVSGFVALMISEFGKEFEREELLKTCYKSAIRYHDDNDWKKKTLLGTVDMRTALFTLHAIKRTRATLAREKINIPFDNILEAIHTILFGMVEEYSSLHLSGESFKENLAGFLKAAQKNRKFFNKDEFLKSIGNGSLDSTLSFVSNFVLHVAKPQRVPAPSGASKTLIQKVKAKLFEKEVDLFEGLSKKEKGRLEEIEQSDKFWEQKIQELKKLRKSPGDTKLLSGIDKGAKREIIKLAKEADEFKGVKVATATTAPEHKAQKEESFLDEVVGELEDVF